MGGERREEGDYGGETLDHLRHDASVNFDKVSPLLPCL
jgi:hypothetical protein